MTSPFRWTSDDVARRAAEHLMTRTLRCTARHEYAEACERFKARHGLERVNTAAPAFRRATKKAYTAYQRARQLEHNAARRLKTAVLGSHVFREVCNDRRR